MGQLIAKPKIFVPILVAAILSVGIIAFAPNAVAEYKHHSIPEITGTIIAADSMSENIAKEKIHFIVATSVAENAVDNGQTLKGRLGVVQGYLVYKFGVADGDDLFYKVIVDAGNGATLYTSEGKSVDDFKKFGHGDKWSHNKMMGSHDKMMSPHGTDYTTGIHGKMMAKHGEMKSHFADLTPEERDAKFAQFKEMKSSFEALSEDDRETIKTHFKDMKSQYADLTEDERMQKHTEFKEKMQEFMQLSLDEKIEHLQEFANSLRNN